MMATIKTGKDFKKAIDLIINYSDRCPGCGSDDIANEDSTGILTCHSCSHQFDDQDYMDKFHIVALLRVKGLDAIAQVVEDMAVQEYEDFLANHIYE